MEHGKLDIALAVADKNRRPFKKNGVWINIPVNTPNGKLLVIERATGTLVALDRPQDFKAQLHRRWNQSEGTPIDKNHAGAHPDNISSYEANKMQEELKEKQLQSFYDEQEGASAKVSNAEPEAKPPAEEPEVIEDGNTTDPQARFEELKTKGFNNLKGAERAEYLELRKVYGQN